MNRLNILVIEDEPALLRSMIEYFRQEDFICEEAATYAQGIQKIEDGHFHCIILDINLPGGTGLQILQYLKKNRKDDGVIIISARNSLDDKLAGLNLGADDYLTKPFHLSELNARIKALMRRKYPQGVNILELGQLRLEILSRTVTCSNKPLPLTRNEYELLAYLMTNKHRVVSKQAIAEYIYGEEIDKMPSLDFVYSQVKNLKKKLKERGCDEMLQTVYGLGYKLSL